MLLASAFSPYCSTSLARLFEGTASHAKESTITGVARFFGFSYLTFLCKNAYMGHLAASGIYIESVNCPLSSIVVGPLSRLTFPSDQVLLLSWQPVLCLSSIATLPE